MLSVIAGGMFAEKSTELLRRGKRLKRAGKRVLFVKPDFDNRYSTSEIWTHDGLRVEALDVNAKNPLQLIHLAKDYDAVLIDEIQFFDELIISVVKSLLINEKTVIVAGLDLDFTGEPFFNTTALMGYAEEVLKLKAVCTSCGEDAWVSHKPDNGQRIQLGTNEYTPLCRKCHRKTIKESKEG